MPTRKFQVSLAGDTSFPRDRVVNTLYFDTNDWAGILVDKPEGLTKDLAEAYANFWTGGPTAREIIVKAYNLGLPPQPPVSEYALSTGVSPGANCPREVALCLSFYAGRNVKSQRGRIFLPVFTCGSAGPVRDLMQVRPTQALRDRALLMADQFSGLGGANVDWVVHSKVQNTSRKVSHAWVDDEWDTQRRRGLRSTARAEKDVSG